MKKVFALLVPVILGAVCSCQKDNALPSVLIVGTWNLVRQAETITEDGVKQPDSTYNSSNQNYSTIQFNIDGTFESINQVLPDAPYGVPTVAVTVVKPDTLRGSYNFASSVLNLSAPPLGISSADFSPGPAQNPMVTVVSQHYHIKLINKTYFNLHIDYTINYSFRYDVTGKTYTNTIATDYYYVR